MKDIDDGGYGFRLGQEGMVSARCTRHKNMVTEQVYY